MERLSAVYETPMLAIACAAGAGLLALVLTGAGLPWFGAGAWAAGTALSATVARRARAGHETAVTLADLVDAVADDPEHPQAGLLNEIRQLGDDERPG